MEIEKVLELKVNDVVTIQDLPSRLITKIAACAVKHGYLLHPSFSTIESISLVLTKSPMAPDRKYLKFENVQRHSSLNTDTTDHGVSVVRLVSRTPTITIGVAKLNRCKGRLARTQWKRCVNVMESTTIEPSSVKVLIVANHNSRSTDPCSNEPVITTPTRYTKTWIQPLPWLWVWNGSQTHNLTLLGTDTSSIPEQPNDIVTCFFRIDTISRVESSLINTDNVKNSPPPTITVAPTSNADTTDNTPQQLPLDPPPPSRSTIRVYRKRT